MPRRETVTVFEVTAKSVVFIDSFGEFVTLLPHDVTGIPTKNKRATLVYANDRVKAFVF